MEQVKVSPRVNVRIEKIRSDHVRTEAYHNLAVDSGLNLIRDFLYGDAVSGLERFALGTGTGQVQAADAKLENEVFRDQLTKVTKTDKGLEIKYYLRPPMPMDTRSVRRGCLRTERRICRTAVRFMRA